MQKIFGYVRESTMQQAMHGYNIEEQKRVIEDYCNALSKELDNIEIKELYFDDLEKSLQKEIIHKYVKLIKVHFKNQGYKITVELIRK